ncbi:hypothetical protein ACFRSX_26070 [Streptomyces goshikiensis]|uniref:hypothetical protein n=1 Tax=Streptomyces TaxID=1883 RepID=UPI000C279DD6|nr:hypothetical protein [Streptomyces sp. CB02120-2]PJN20079.1 hypothetical protein CG724_07770 [Streptomyces sp. CB02120-2]
MRARTTIFLAAFALTLTACGTSAPAPDRKLAATSSPAPPNAASSSVPAAALQLGQSTETVGAGGTGTLEITPTSIAYISTDGSTKPVNDVFAFVTYKARATTAVAADQAAPVDGGGWSWAAPDGQAIAQGNGEAYNVVADSFNAGRTVQPGTYLKDAAVFDLATAQAGGTLIYIDGAGTAYRWAMPKTDAGPDVAQIRKELAP